MKELESLKVSFDCTTASVLAAYMGIKYTLENGWGGDAAFDALYNDAPALRLYLAQLMNFGRFLRIDPKGLKSKGMDRIPGDIRVFENPNCNERKGSPWFA